MKIGEYEVVRLLGKGGMSEVYEVERASTGTRHALKLFAYPKESEEVLARFKTEGLLLAKLDHPRIVKVTDIGTDAASGKPYFVMGLVLDPAGEIKTLGDIPEGSVGEETIGGWYDDIREGLAYIHGKGVVHRDLKLQNVMIGPDGRAVITDFGVSKIFDPDDSSSTVVDPVQTIVQMRDGKRPVMGSIGYMAPEVELGVEASPKSDWYALGVITYKLLTGMWCDAKTDVGDTLDTYDPAWKRIIPKLLHSNPEGRVCLSWAEETARDREEREALLEERYLREKRRGHVARHVARYAGAASVALAVALGATLWEFRSQREVWRLRLENAGARPATPSFNELFKIPAEARGTETTDAGGAVVMPSRREFEAARVDALVLTQNTMSSLEAGSITVEKAIEDFENLLASLDDDAVRSPFDNLSFGDMQYMQFGETEPLRILLQRAIDRLRAAAER